METWRNPNSRDRRRPENPGSGSAWLISASTRQHAQEADATMARDEGKPYAPGVAPPTQRPAESGPVAP
ncbi:hypothetical protein [Hymenobacter sp.]|uniref:hypothetical protein n=1 Tax=Hymenobacter sp. TaxID=1898978 RepID=UPI00286A6A8C|nr:hypothetical protein [Hymenobacter sp.]